MTELKTLKDLRNCNCKYEHSFRESELRAEAVKWVKDGLKGIKKAKDDRDNETNGKLNYYEGWVGAFMDLFNLTEADLEEEE